MQHAPKSSQVPNVEPIMHLYHENKGHDCDLRVLFNLHEIRRLIRAGHAECVLAALDQAQTIVETIIDESTTGNTLTTVGKPC